MAGAGYKLFNTGDVLTAQQVNEYLMQQTVMVFANAAARTTALSGVLAEGMISYLKDTNAVERYDGSAWSAIGAGDIEGVTAGTGLSGGGSSGTVTLTNDMATTITASGDIVVGTGNATYDNLPIGTTGQVLTADTTVSPYKVKWAAPSAGANWSLLNAGGTSLSSTTTTVSGISGADKIMILIEGASNSTASLTFYFRLNGDTGNNYYYYGPQMANPSTYNTTIVDGQGANADKVFLGSMSSNAASTINGYVLISGCNSSGVKVFNSAASGKSASSTYGAEAFILGGYYNSSNTISSVSIVCTTGGMDAGKVYVYTSA